jgi:hypothetical protein
MLYQLSYASLGDSETGKAGYGNRTRVNQLGRLTPDR